MMRACTGPATTITEYSSPIVSTSIDIGCKKKKKKKKKKIWGETNYKKKKNNPQKKK
eukprot:NODE_18625_length_884_cov_2.822985.p5 GENE.NODE_18625_length_884_cov_2.822985~~NODE_18625_length_884_cov_2.822985.p5  ORF type:complete len:57 (+),score=39.17 NODE_18625_length_884_cov_2.822985:611-781(+)